MKNALHWLFGCLGNLEGKNMMLQKCGAAQTLHTTHERNQDTKLLFPGRKLSFKISCSSNIWINISIKDKTFSKNLKRFKQNQVSIQTLSVILNLFVKDGEFVYEEISSLILLLRIQTLSKILMIITLQLNQYRRNSSCCLI